LSRLRKLKNAPEIYIFLSVTIFYTYELIKHQLWRDETQAWLIALVSRNPHQLIANLKYESRPPLWYLILKISSLISANPNTMKVVVWVLTIISFIFILWTRSIHLAARSSWLLGYFFIFGYSVVTRDYVLIFTAVTILVYLRLEKPELKLPYYLTLLILGSTNLFGLFFLVSWVFAMILVNRKLTWKILVKMRIEIMILVTTTVEILLFRSPKDSQFNLNFHAGIKHTIFEIIGNLRDALLPINFSSPNKNFITAITFLVSISIIGLIFFTIDNFAKFFLGTFTALFLFNGAFGYSEYWWHRGTLVLAIFIAVNLGKKSTTNENARAHTFVRDSIVNLSAKAIPLFLLLQVTGTIFGYGVSFYEKKPYSNISAAAKYVSRACIDHCQIIEDSGVFAAGISASLKGREIFTVDRNDFGTFAIWKKGFYSTPSWSEILAATDRFPNSIIVTTELDRNTAPANLKLLAKFAPSVWGDDYYIYKRIN